MRQAQEIVTFLGGAALGVAAYYISWWLMLIVPLGVIVAAIACGVASGLFVGMRDSSSDGPPERNGTAAS